MSISRYVLIIIIILYDCIFDHLELGEIFMKKLFILLISSAFLSADGIVESGSFYSESLDENRNYTIYLKAVILFSHLLLSNHETFL